MAAIAATSTATVVAAGATVAGAGAAAVFGSVFLAGAGVALAFTPAFFLAPTLIAAASVPVTAGEEIPMDYQLESNPYDLQNDFNQLIQISIESDYMI